MPLSFKRNIRFRQKQEQRLDVFSFDGGLVLDRHETKLNPNQSPNLQNITYNESNSVKTRNGFIRYNGNPVGVSADQSNTGASTGSLPIVSVNDFVAQSFQPSGDIEVVQLDVYLAMENSGEEQRVRLEIWSDDTGPDAILTNLAKSQILNVSGTSEAAYSFRFKTPISLSSATTYHIVIRPYRSSSSASVNQVNVYHRGTTYANGQVYTSDDGGVTWTGDANKDLRFVVYSGGDTGGTGLIRFYGTSGIQQLLAKIGTGLYRGNDSTGALTSISLGNGGTLNSSNPVFSTVSNGTLLLVDDSGRIQKYRGSTNSNYTTGTISVTNGDATVTGSGTSWNTSTNAEVGEYIKLPDGKWYKIISIASDTSLEVEIEYQGSTSSGQSYTISPWGEVQGKLNTSTAPSSLVRPAPKDIENHINRIWTIEGNSLKFSVLDTSVDEENFNDFDTASNAGEIIVPSSRGDSCTGIYSFNGVLYVFQKRSIWGLYGNSPANFELRNISNEVGMTDKRTLREWEGILIFLSEKGVIFFDGSNYKNVTDGVVGTLIDSWANKTSPAACLWGNKYVISYTPSGSTYNSEALVIDLMRFDPNTGKNLFSKLTSVYAGFWSEWGGGTDTGQIYFISSNQGSIYRWDIGGNDDGYEIHTIWDTPSLGFGANVNDKSMKRVYLQQVATGDHNMDVTMFADIDGAETTSQVNLSGGDTALWDVAEWDADNWSSEGSIITTLIAEFQGIAKYFKFRFEEEGYDTGIEILGITINENTRRLS